MYWDNNLWLKPHGNFIGVRRSEDALAAYWDEKNVNVVKSLRSFRVNATRRFKCPQKTEIHVLKSHEVNGVIFFFSSMLSQRRKTFYENPAYFIFSCASDYKRFPVSALSLLHAVKVRMIGAYKHNVRAVIGALELGIF